MDTFSILHEVMLVLESTFLLYFIYVVGYTFIFAIGSFFYRIPIFNTSIERRIAVFIPAYKEDNVIVEVAKAAVNHDYPNDKFDIVIIADSLKQGTIVRLESIEKLTLVKVDFTKSTKVKALQEAFKQLDGGYDIGVILDADNIMNDNFLHQVNGAFSTGDRAIQGQRMAKNQNTSMAFLDAVSESINNRIYRQGTSALGQSCSFIGSGMAIDYELMKSTLLEMDSVGGFDRDMEVKLIDKGYKVYYVKNAIVYDEKVENTTVFANQRQRWIYSQYHYLFKQIKPGLKQLFKGNFVYFNSAVLRNIQLPRLINLGLLFLLVVFTMLLPSMMNFSYAVWLALWVLLVFSNVISIPRKFYNKDFLKALLSLPKVFAIMFSLLFKLRGSNKSFIHTPHNKVSK